MSTTTDAQQEPQEPTSGPQEAHGAAGGQEDTPAPQDGAAERDERQEDEQDGDGLAAALRDDPEKAARAKLAREAAGYRSQLREAEAANAALTSHLDTAREALFARVVAEQRQDRLMQLRPEALDDVFDAVGDYFDDDGHPDVGKINTRLAEVYAAKPHFFAKDLNTPGMVILSGDNGDPQMPRETRDAFVDALSYDRPFGGTDLD